jgi:hypothetical protein
MFELSKDIKKKLITSYALKYNISLYDYDEFIHSNYRCVVLPKKLGQLSMDIYKYEVKHKIKKGLYDIY